MPQIDVFIAKTDAEKKSLKDFVAPYVDNKIASEFSSYHPYTKEADELTGTLRISDIKIENFEDKVEFALAKWLEILEPEEISFTSAFVIANTKRKNRTVLTLMKRHYELLLKQNKRLDLICPSEHIQGYYEWLGYRRISRAFNKDHSAWPVVPMALALRDFDYLKRINSPLVSVLKNKNYEEDKSLSLFIEKNFSNEYMRHTAYILLRRLTQRYNLFFKNELMEPYIKAIKHNRFINGEKVYSEGDYGSSLHLVIRGTARTITRYYSSGDIFGAGCLLHPGPRELTVLAENDLETLELDSADFYLILKSKPHTAPVILNILGQHLKDLNTRFINEKSKNLS